MNSQVLCENCYYREQVRRPSRRIAKRFFSRVLDYFLVAVILKIAGIDHQETVFSFYVFYCLTACFFDNQTLGRFLLGLRVKSRGKIGLIRLLIRELCFFLLFPIVAVQILTGFRLLHDLIASTYVSIDND